MKINQPAPTNLSPYTSRNGTAQGSGTYRIGQILHATVVSNSHHGQVSLRIGNTEVTASSQIALQQNTHLSLKVIQLQPRLLLQVMPGAGNNPLQEALKNLLPRQISLAPLLAELAHKTQTRETSSRSSPGTARNALLAALPERSDIRQAEGLQRAVMQSGLFLEAKLATTAAINTTNLSSDLKSLLLRYMKSLKQTHDDSPAKTSMAQTHSKQQSGEIPPPLKGRLPLPHPPAPCNPTSTQDSEPNDPALHKKLQGALARLGLLQIATAENFDDGHTLWQLEIPVRHGNAIEMVALTIEKEQAGTRNDEPTDASWAVNLSLDLPTLGPLQSRINMDTAGLSTTFWSESPETLSIIENRLAELRANFEQHGLKPHRLSCRAGQQPASQTPPQPEPPLIDYQI